VTGTFLNVGTVLAGTLLGTLAGSRLPTGIQQRVLAGLGLVTLVIGVDAALAWRDTNPLYVLGGVLLGGSPAKRSASSGAWRRSETASRLRFRGVGRRGCRRAS